MSDLGRRTPWLTRPDQGSPAQRRTRLASLPVRVSLHTTPSVYPSRESRGVPAQQSSSYELLLCKSAGPMKLTPELLAATQTSLNPLGDRELDLRGHKIPTIENLGVTRDQVDTLDLSDNDILALGNFPHLDRLAHLLLSNNLISRIEPRLAFSLPRLTTLVLTNNQLSSFHQLLPLGKFPMLEYLSLIGNPIARERHYREFVVAKCKSLRVLDFRRIKDKVRFRPVQSRGTIERVKDTGANLGSTHDSFFFFTGTHVIEEPDADFEWPTVRAGSPARST